MIPLLLAKNVDSKIKSLALRREVPCDVVNTNARIDVAETISELGFECPIDGIVEAARYCGIDFSNPIYGAYDDEDLFSMVAVSDVDGMEEAYSEVTYNGEDLVAIVVFPDGYVLFSRTFKKT